MKGTGSSNDCDLRRLDQRKRPSTRALPEPHLRLSLFRLFYLDLPALSHVTLCWEPEGPCTVCWNLQNLWLDQGRWPAPVQLPQCHHWRWAPVVFVTVGLAQQRVSSVLTG